MNYKELNTAYLGIFDFIQKQMLKDALDGMNSLSNHCKNMDLKSQLDNHTETYRNILKYSFELGDDPDKEKVYNRLIRSVIGLADDMKEDIIRSYGLLKYYSLMQYPDPDKERIISEFASMIDRILLEHEADSDNKEGDAAIGGNHFPGYSENLIVLFYIIWMSDKLSDAEIHLLELANRPSALPWYDKCLLVSALTLSLLRHFDSNKINLLFGFYESNEIQVWQRAIVGLVLIMAYYDKRLPYYPEILQRLKALQGLNHAEKTIGAIIIQFSKARETEKITKRIQQEILPEMIKMKTRLEEKLDLENLLSSANDEEKNPEWESFFKDSPDVYNKLEEFSNLQMEGADVFLGAFAMLKHFDFFNEVSNWFIPFFKENEAVMGMLQDVSGGMDIKQFSEGIERSNFLCNSDKYSFCLNVKHMPSMQKSTVLELFNMELNAMNEMAADDELINSETHTRAIITQYLQDLYRFFKLHPLKAEFEDIFKMAVPIYETAFFNLWVEDMNVLRNIGEFFFEKNYYRESLRIFNKIVSKMNNYELHEKIAYCYQQLGEFDKALDNYHKAELFDKNRFWLVNRIAFCYRKKGDFARAMDYYHEAEKLEPESLQVQVYLGQTLMELGSYEEALKYFFKVEYLQPENYKIFRTISWCSFMLGKLDTAKKYIEKSIGHEKNRNDYVNLGHINWSLGNKKAAIENYKTGLQLSNMDYEWFAKVIKDDAHFLAEHGIHAFDIPLMIDYIKLSLIP